MPKVTLIKSSRSTTNICSASPKYLHRNGEQNSAARNSHQMHRFNSGHADDGSAFRSIDPDGYPSPTLLTLDDDRRAAPAALPPPPSTLDYDCHRLPSALNPSPPRFIVAQQPPQSLPSITPLDVTRVEPMFPCAHKAEIVGLLRSFDGTGCDDDGARLQPSSSAHEPNFQSNPPRQQQPKFGGMPPSRPGHDNRARNSPPVPLGYVDHARGIPEGHLGAQSPPFGAHAPSETWDLSPSQSSPSRGVYPCPLDTTYNERGPEMPPSHPGPASYQSYMGPTASLGDRSLTTPEDPTHPYCSDVERHHRPRRTELSGWRDEYHAVPTREERRGSSRSMRYFNDGGARISAGRSRRDKPLHSKRSMSEDDRRALRCPSESSKGEGSGDRWRRSSRNRENETKINVHACLSNATLPPPLSPQPIPRRQQPYHRRSSSPDDVDSLCYSLDSALETSARRIVRPISFTDTREGGKSSHAYRMSEDDRYDDRSYDSGLQDRPKPHRKYEERSRGQGTRESRDRMSRGKREDSYREPLSPAQNSHRYGRNDIYRRDLDRRRSSRDDRRPPNKFHEDEISSRQNRRDLCQPVYDSDRYHARETKSSHRESPTDDFDDDQDENAYGAYRPDPGVRNYR